MSDQDLIAVLIRFAAWGFVVIMLGGVAWVQMSRDFTEEVEYWRNRQR